MRIDNNHCSKYLINADQIPQLKNKATNQPSSHHPVPESPAARIFCLTSQSETEMTVQ